MKPFIVYEIRNKESKLEYKGKPIVLGEVMSTHTSQWMREAMRQAVEKGTGRSADVPGVKVAGKTGTAQVPGAGGYLKGSYTPSFVGFWPYDNPKYLLLIVIGNPREGDFLGGKVAAPIFRSIVQDIELIS